MGPGHPRHHRGALAQGGHRLLRGHHRPAGENLLPYACIINSRNHSAGAGTAAVLGSKKCKALVVRGTQPIYVANPQEVADLSDYMLREIVGSNNNHVVPSTQQEWAEYFDKGSRWTAQKGLTWALAEGGRSTPASRSPARSTPWATAA